MPPTAGTHTQPGSGATGSGRRLPAAVHAALLGQLEGRHGANSPAGPGSKGLGAEQPPRRKLKHSPESTDMLSLQPCWMKVS